MKNIDKKIRALLVVFILAMVATITVSVVSFVSSFQDPEEETQETNKYSEKNEKNKVTYTDGKEGEYPEEDSENLYQMLIQKAQLGSFQSVMDDVNEVRERYQLTEDYNQKLIQVYQDANVIPNIKSTDVVSEEISLYRGISDMRMKCIGLFWLSNTAKANAVIRNDSICPFIYDASDEMLEFQDYEVLEFSDTSDPFLAEMKQSYEEKGFYLNSVQDEIEPKVYKCYFSVDEIPMTFYLVKRLDNSWTVYSIQYRNEDTYNENWETMSFYYNSTEFNENSPYYQGVEE